MKMVDFERYMLVDDHADYPMVIPVRMSFHGVANRERLEKAFEKTVKDHPLLRARLEDVEGKPVWSACPDIHFHWSEKVPRMIRLDLFQSTGIRVYAHQREEELEITLFIHHSVSDGAGICQLVDDWLEAYQGGETGDDPGFGTEIASTGPLAETTDETGLSRRGRFGMNFLRYLLRPFQEFCGFLGVMEFFSHQPVALGPQKVEPLEPGAELTHQHSSLRFSAQETRSLVEHSRRTGYKLNDMLLAAMYWTCQQWLEKHHPEESHRHQRIMIPIDMRDKKNPEKFVANSVSMIFLDRRPARYRSISQLCWYIWLEMTAIKIMKLGLTFAHLIRFYLWRNRLPQLLRRDRSIATTTLSNMGRIFKRSQLKAESGELQAGELTLKRFLPFPPVRRYTWMTTLVSTYANRLDVAASWCPEGLQAEDVDEILTEFKHNLLTGFPNHMPETETEQEPG